MPSLSLQWNFDKPTYAPGETATISLWANNDGSNPLLVSAAQAEFDFGKYPFPSNTPIMPRQRGFIGSKEVPIPAHIVGTKSFSVRVRVLEQEQGTWVDQGELETDRPCSINIFALPWYRVFVSRSIDPADGSIYGPLETVLRQWGFNLTTVGVPQPVNETQVLPLLRQGVRQADAVIAIATPRIMNAMTGLWHTLEWLHGETGVAFGANKAMLILRDSRTQLTALPGYLAQHGDVPMVEFDPYNMDDATDRLSRMMLPFREWIATKRKLEFEESRRQLWKGIGIGALATIGIMGGVAAVMGTHRANSRRISEDVLRQPNSDSTDRRVGP